MLPIIIRSSDSYANLELLTKNIYEKIKEDERYELVKKQQYENEWILVNVGIQDNGLSKAEYIKRKDLNKHLT